MENWKGWFLDLDREHKGIISSVIYVLANGGGLVWPILYVIFLVKSWLLWGNTMHTIWIIVGIVMSVIALLNRHAWKYLLTKKEDEYNKRVNEIKGKCNKKINELIVTEEVKSIDDAYYSFMSFFDQLQLWQKSRDVGIEDKVIQVNKNLLDSIINLKRKTNDTA